MAGARHLHSHFRGIAGLSAPELSKLALDELRARRLGLATRLLLSESGHAADQPVAIPIATKGVRRIERRVY